MWATVTVLASLPPAAALAYWRYRRGQLLSVGVAWSERARIAEAIDLGAQGEQLLADFDHKRDAAALSVGIDRLGKAVEHSHGSRHQAGLAVSLVMALVGRYDRLRNPDDLDRAIDVAQRAVENTSHDVPERARLLVALGHGLQVRYGHVGDYADLQRALEAGRAAARAAPSGHEFRPTCLEILSNILADCFERDGNPSDRDEAIRLGQEILATVPRRSDEGIAALLALGSWILQTNERGSLLAIDQAVDYGRRAVKAAPAKHPQGYSAHRQLSLALRARYERRGDTEDLDGAIRQAELAVRGLAPDDALRIRGQLALAEALGHRYERFRQRADLKRAIAEAQAATLHTAAEAPLRVVAWLTAGKIAMDHREYDTAVKAVESAVALLPHVAGRELTAQDQEHRLGKWNGVASLAASCALAANAPDQALRLLEGGRGILLTRALSTPSDLTELRSQLPDLATELSQAADTLDTGTALSQRRRQRETHEGVLERIRAHEGFEAFARPPSIDDLLSHAAQGPVVYLLSAPERGYAILLTVDGVRTVPLPGASSEAVVERVATLLEAVAPNRVLDRDAQPAVHEVLAWLWDAVAEPILKSLSLPDSIAGQLPRVWWVPTGMFTFLPVHAAGHHRAAPTHSRPETVLDRVTSSYVPTVRTLAAVRSATQSGSGGHPHPLVVALPETPGANELRNATREARLISSLFPTARVLVREQATRGRVEAELTGRSWVHFACHGHTDTESPSRSRLLLHDHEHRPFTVADVSALQQGLRAGRELQQRVRAPEMAYLSTCDSARTSPRLADESLHLAAAFQLAGFPQVVAALWPLADEAAYSFAEDFYRHIHATHTPGARLDAATAVRHATLKARASFPSLPAVWAGHVHFGA
ncbi:CHAT domain-containing protein [Streptomyces rectiviolaceus]